MDRQNFAPLSADAPSIDSTVFAGVIGSAACAVLLHLSSDRPDAAWVVPIAIAWGAAVVALAPRSPERGPVALCAIALLVRLPLVGTPTLLSDDLYRYLWEGLALGAGHDVFREAPATIDGLNDALRARVNHPEVPSVYPPLALAWFRLLSLGGTAWFVQLATAAVDATVPAAIRSATGRSWPALLYAVHPLAVLESAAGGHVDVPAVALATAAVAAWRADRRDLGFGVAVAAALVKLFPLAWLPVLVRGAGVKRGAVWVGAGALASAALIGLAVGWTVPEGVRTYATTWSFNGLVYPWLPADRARPVLLAAGGLVAGVVLVRVRDPGVAWYALGVAFLALSPTVHPWYALWALAPSLLCEDRRFSAAVLPLIGSYLVLLAYDPATGRWAEAPWLWWSTWPPALAVGAAWTLAQRRPPSEARPTAPNPPANSARNGSEPR
jgi:hypothetical protein